MANLRTSELGRHKWVQGYREVKAMGQKRDVLKCGNCGKTHDLAHGDPPVIGCISDIDLTKLGKSMQADQLERDMRGGLYASHG